MEWQSLLFGQEDASFLIEAVVRTIVMFLVIVVGLRMLGKRGIHQLSVFELGVIIGLGSAAGDPMFYKDVGLLPSILVFAIVVSMYRGVTFFISRSDKVEALIEGKPSYILEDGVILEDFKKQPFGKDELFEQLRQDHVYHLGQLERVILESDGQVSIYFFEDEEVKPGLPILPHLLDQVMTEINEKGNYSCFACGFTEMIASPAASFACKSCGHRECVAAIAGLRRR